MTQLYARSQIDIFVNVLSSDGGVFYLFTGFLHESLTVLVMHLGMLSAAINATTLALIHAGISLTRPLSSLSVSALHDTPLLDPSGTEETDLPTVTVACLAPSTTSSSISDQQDPYEGQVTLVNMETRLSIDRFEGMLKLAVQGCRVISEEMDNVIRTWTEGMAESLKAGQQIGAGLRSADMDLS